MNNKKIISVIAVIMAVLMLASLVVSMIPVSAFADEPEGLSDLQGSEASSCPIRSRSAWRDFRALKRSAGKRS